MKIRIQQNALRFRLQNNEVHDLASGKSLSLATQISTEDSIGFNLSVTDEDIVQATIESHITFIKLPKKEVLPWSNSDSLSLNFELNINAQNTLHVLVEKDLSKKVE